MRMLLRHRRLGENDHHPGYNLFQEDPGSIHEVSSSSSNSFETAGDDYPVLGVAVLACLLVLLATVLMILVVFLCRQRQQWRSISLTRRQHHPKSTTKISPERIERRYRTIEGWLISKRVVAHGLACQRCAPSTKQSTLQQHTKASTTTIWQGLAQECRATLSELEDGDDAPKECSICMEAFAVGDIVSWSPTSNSCNHVFHHQCIKVRI